MRVRNYLEKLSASQDVTFIKARARKDANTPFYHPEYQTTPIWKAGEWLASTSDRLMDSIVLNDRQMPIDWLCGAKWGDAVKNGTLRCLLVVSPDDFAALYRGKDQRESMEKHCEDRLFGKE